MKNSIILILAIIGFLLSACIQENPNLVNPPSSKDKIFVRFINLSGDKKPRSLIMNGESFFTSEYGMNTVAINPPEDSVLAGVNNGNISEFTISRKVKFMKESHNSFFALPSPKGSPNYRAIDTLIPVSSSTGLPQHTIHSYLKMINVFPDSTISFSVIMGCPNSNPIFNAVNYKSVTSQEVLNAGIYAISLLKNSNGKSEVLGLFDINLLNDRQYLIIISEGIDQNIKFSLLDETNNEIISISEPNIVLDKKAYLRTINLSSEDITVKKLPNEIVTPSVPINYIGEYDQISACTSQGIDSILVEYSGFSPSANSLSINVNKKYTYLVSDQGKKKAGSTIIIPEAYIEYPLVDKTLIRVINIADENSEYTLSVAARQDTNQLSFTAGETIASKLKFGVLSNNCLLPIHEANNKVPLTLFSNTSPAKLLKSFSYNFQAQKNYLIIIKKNLEGNEEIIIVEDSQESLNAESIKNEQFFRLINLVSGSDFINVSLNGVFNNAKLDYFTSISSVVKLGNNSININDNEYHFTANENERNILIAMGNRDNIELLDIKSENHPDLNSNQTRFRIMNATLDVSSVKITLGKEDKDLIASGLIQKHTTEYRTELKGKVYSFYFYNEQNDKLILNANEIKIVEGKVYTIILAGDAKNGYNVYITQEF